MCQTPCWGGVGQGGGGDGIIRTMVSLVPNNVLEVTINPLVECR